MRLYTLQNFDQMGAFYLLDVLELSFDLFMGVSLRTNRYFFNCHNFVCLQINSNAHNSFTPSAELSDDFIFADYLFHI